MSSKNDIWLSKTKEVALEPSLPICDSHHHLWEFKNEFIQPKYLIDDYIADINSGHNIKKTIFIECGSMLRKDGPNHLKYIGETEFANGIAAMSSSGKYGKTRVASGIVSSAPLLENNKKLLEVLNGHIMCAGKRFKGIRYQAAMHKNKLVYNSRVNPPDGIYNCQIFRDNFKELYKLKLSFEAWCYHTQLNDLYDLAKSFPKTIIILNHFGGPIGIGPFKNKNKEVFDDWRISIKKLAQLKNIYIKLGGLAMDINGFEWHKKKNAPSSIEYVKKTYKYYETAIETFGINRCMFESNFPVDKKSISYVNLWNSFKIMTRGYSINEKNKLFYKNACKIYKLN